MIKLSEDIRALAACYQRLAERSINPRFREGFARLAARYEAIAARREAAEHASMHGFREIAMKAASGYAATSSSFSNSAESPHQS
jgi:hypothetical protein